MANLTCVFSHADGSFFCITCVPEDGDPNEFDPVRADDELEEAPICAECGRRHCYMIISSLDRIAESLERIGDEMERARERFRPGA